MKTDGRCVEGLEKNACPYYGKPLAATATAGDTPAERHGIVLPSGDLLDQEKASQLLRRGDSRVIAVVAPKEAGKTTLIASIFELFLRGPIGPFEFAGSRTMYAFERASHPSRSVSRNARPETERTLLTTVKFYHAALCRPGGATLDLVVADRNGEDYGAAPDDTGVVREFVEIHRADTITFLVDGRQLVDPVTRSRVGADILAIAQALVDGGGVMGRPRVAIVLTKFDDIARSADKGRSRRDFEKIVEKFHALHASLFGEIRSFEVAACPSDVSLPLGHGVADLLAYWEAPVALVVPKAASHVSSSTRFMNRLQGAPE
ncbi:TRAFAC clade GTPase domain-containing protein [Bradyrhizobium sp. 23AC]